MFVCDGAPQAGVSRLLATLTSDVEAASGGVTTAAVHLLETAAYAVGGIVLCLRLNLRLTFVVLLCVAPTVFLSRLARRALRSTGDAASSARAEVMAAAETSLLSAELVRAYGMEDAEAAIFRRAVARSSSANKARQPPMRINRVVHASCRAGPDSLSRPLHRTRAASVSSWEG